MRTFAQLRGIMDNNQGFAAKINSLEERYNEQFTLVSEAIKSLPDAEKNSPEDKPLMGFHP